MVTNKGDMDSENMKSKDFTIADREEYFIRLEKWLQQAYAWQNVVAMFPYYVASTHMLNMTPGSSPEGVTQNQSNIRNTVPNTRPEATTNQVNDTGRPRRADEPAAAQFEAAAAEGLEYRIPPIWKRFIAELIDSMVLFLLRLSITFIAIDIFDFIEVERYYLDLLQVNLKIDYKMGLEFSGILIFELIHRVLACIFEASWLQHGRNGRIGGATPGKSVMGLRVIQCRSVTPIERPDEPEVVVVTPGTDLGLLPALGRSILKNFILVFLFPICFALCLFRFNRTGYDLVCNSIVVEDPYRNFNNNNNNINNNRVRR